MVRRSIIAAAAVAVLGTTGALLAAAGQRAQRGADADVHLRPQRRPAGQHAHDQPQQRRDTGPVTGGPGSFVGATGTITGTSVAKKREAITITYST